MKNINCCLVSGQQPDGIDQTDETTTEITTASNGNWTPPSNWTGRSSAFYQSFDSSDGFILMEGTQNASDPVPLVPGKVSYITFFSRKIISIKLKSKTKSQSTS